jgi:hypothetical protein
LWNSSVWRTWRRDWQADDNPVALIDTTHEHARAAVDLALDPNAVALLSDNRARQHASEHWVREDRSSRRVTRRSLVGWAPWDGPRGMGSKLSEAAWHGTPASAPP